MLKHLTFLTRLAVVAEAVVAVEGPLDKDTAGMFLAFKSPPHKRMDKAHKQADYKSPHITYGDLLLMRLVGDLKPPGSSQTREVAWLSPADVKSIRTSSWPARPRVGAVRAQHQPALALVDEVAHIPFRAFAFRIDRKSVV